jgi:ABC-type nitrate/sulfonate/bicarbonate transport system substrate-binding protein
MSAIGQCRWSQLEQSGLLDEAKFRFPWKRVGVRRRYENSPVKGEEVVYGTGANTPTKRLSSPATLPVPLSCRETQRKCRLGPIVIYIMVVCAVFMGLARAGSAAESARFLVSYGGTAGYQLPLWVNKELGFSKKYGVDLEIVLIQAGSPNIQALLGGSIQLTQTAASSAVLGAVRGAPVVIVATLENKLPMLLISRPEIKEPQQLRGKVIGINRFGGSNDAAVLMAIKAWKMDPKDITMLQTGGTSARMAALLSKKIDATVQSYPEIYQARKLGMNVLADIGDFGFYTNTSNIVTRSYLQQNRAAVKGFIKGQIEGMHYVKTNKEGSLKILKKHLQVTDPEAVEGTYEFFAKRLPRVPRTEAEGIKNILTSMDAAQKEPGEFLDMSLIDEIEKEGFIKKLYAQ